MIAIRRLKQGQHVTLGVENGADEFGRCRGLTLADAVEGGFAMVGKGCELVETEHRARALQRVKAAKHGVDLGLVFEVAGEVEEAGFDQLKLFERLGFEHCNGILIVHRPRTFLVILTSMSGSNGLVSQPVAPASLACCFSSPSDSVVRKITGVPM